LSSFAHTPNAFFEGIKEFFLPVAKGMYKPTLAHHFIVLLYNKGLLLRNYTQNIDTLEHQAGLPSDKLVEAHGSFASATCHHCSFKMDTIHSDTYFWKKIEKGELPTCLKCENAPNGPHLLKPDVVLFGEPLPARFFDLSREDFKICDLVIVMGTSLMVYPFAGLPNDAKQDVPRLLFNKEAVGPFTKGSQEVLKDGQLIKTHTGIKGTYRDVAVLGDIDQSVLKLCEMLGWEINK